MEDFSILAKKPDCFDPNDVQSFRGYDHLEFDGKSLNPFVGKYDINDVYERFMVIK